MLDQAALPWFAELNRGLGDALDDAQFRARLRESTARLQALASEMLARGCSEQPTLDGAALRALISGRVAPPDAPALLADFA
jgi:hypothetical protein